MARRFIRDMVWRPSLRGLEVDIPADESFHFRKAAKFFFVDIPRFLFVDSTWSGLTDGPDPDWCGDLREVPESIEPGVQPYPCIQCEVHC